MKAHKGRTAEQLWDALERSELKREQQDKMIQALKAENSRLQSLVIAIRNLTLPPGKKVLSEDLEKEKRDGQED